MGFGFLSIYDGGHDYTLSIEKTEMNRQNFFIVFLMYFTYSQAWIALVIYSLFVEIKHRLFKQEVKWYKTERYNQKKKAGDFFEIYHHMSCKPYADHGDGTSCSCQRRYSRRLDPRGKQPETSQTASSHKRSLDLVRGKRQRRADVSNSGGRSSAHQQLTLEYEASDLLISPSSLTAEIDGEPVKTVKLAGNTGKKTLKLALNKSQSSQGFHSLSLKFYGVVHEGVCVRQDSSGNWIKIYPDSRLNIGEKNESKGVALEHYPYPFAQSGSSVEKTAIVIPDHPSSAEIEAAVKTEAYLKTVDNSISTKILGESDLAKIDRPTIMLGVQHHWSGKVKKLLKQAKLDAKGDKLLLAERMLKAKDKQQPVLFAAASSDDVLSEKISVITDKTYAAQLSGDTLAIGKLQQHNKRDGGKLTLEDFGTGI